MNQPAAITAQLVDVRNVGMHKCIKLTLHVPAELAGQVMAAFGWPTAVDPVPVALARLTNGDGHTSPAGGEAATSGGDSLPSRPKLHKRLIQQAAICCNDPVFKAFLHEHFSFGHRDERSVADFVRNICGVASRKEFIPMTVAGNKWEQLYSQFIAWRDVPEMAAS